MWKERGDGVKKRRDRRDGVKERNVKTKREERWLGEGGRKGRNGERERERERERKSKPPPPPPPQKTNKQTIK